MITKFPFKRHQMVHLIKHKNMRGGGSPTVYHENIVLGFLFCLFGIYYSGKKIKLFKESHKLEPF